MTFEVFVSFRGIDTRRTFVSHLLLSLSKKHITTFKQEEDIPWNQPASSQVLDAIQDSEIAIVVISKNYTGSISCLDQLAKIVECKEKQRLVMIPVLYEVDPSDVLAQAENLREHSGEAEEKVMRWRDALTESINIYLQKHAYWEDEDSYSYIIDRVMFHVLDSFKPPPKLFKRSARNEVYPTFKMSRFILSIPLIFAGLVKVAIGTIAGRFEGKEKPIGFTPRPVRSTVYMHKDEYVTDDELSQLVPSSDFHCLVGMDRQMKEVDALLLGLDSKQVGEIGIWGVEGVGKTTLARFVYQQISPQFQDHYYVLIDSEDNYVGLHPTCLLEEVTRSALTSGSESLCESVKAKFGHRKVLLVVDDLYRTDHLRSIRKIARWFGPGSRLIFVTEKNNVLVQCEVRRVFEVEPLRYDEALQLFSQFAFKQEHVPREYHRLSVRAVLLTGRIPLSLKVFGSFLHGKFVTEWELELCRLEASQDKCVAEVSSYIGNCFS